jgi:hypothetical protein
MVIYHLGLWFRPQPSQSQPSLMALAQPPKFESPSCQKPGQSHSLQTKPGWHITIYSTGPHQVFTESNACRHLSRLAIQKGSWPPLPVLKHILTQQFNHHISMSTHSSCTPVLSIKLDPLQIIIGWEIPLLNNTSSGWQPIVVSIWTI